GVVNAIDNRIPLDLPDAPVTGDASASFATAANTRQGSALLDARAGQFAIHADVLGRKTDDYAIPSGTQSNSFSRAEGVSLGSSYFFGDNRAGAAIIHYDSRYGIPAEDAFIDMKQTKGLFGSSFAFENGVLEKLTVDAGYADYVHSEKEPDGTIGSTFKDKEWDARAELVFDEIGALSSAAVGTQFQGRKFSALGEGAEYLLPTDTDTAAGFAFAEAPLSDTIALQVGARVEHVSVTGTPVSGVLTQRSYTPISGSAGLVFNPTDMLTFGLTASSAARAPAQTELFSRGPHDGPQTYEIGDPTLHTERANSAEATLHFNDERLHLEGALWVTKFNRYIFGNLTGQVCDEDGICGNDPDAELKEMFYAQRDATFRGFEASATFTLVDSPSGTLDLETLADYVRATFDGNGGNVPRIPPYHIGGGVSWASDSFDASVLLKYAGKQTKTGAAETETRGFADLRAQIAWRPFAARPGVEFAIVGKNLTNETQRNATALNKDEVIQPGRDVRFMVRTSF
ncbi:MAG: TonB-dependent receptor, partial [Rhodobacteraceae bacterium]|nr:TonB-dependent receptor [Paracoccaceae bacterium]